MPDLILEILITAIIARLCAKANLDIYDFMTYLIITIVLLHFLTH